MKKTLSLTLLLILTLACGKSDDEKLAEHNARVEAHQKEKAQKAEEAFNALSQDGHVMEAQKALQASNWSLLEKHAKALPDSNGKKAGFLTRVKAEKAREAVEAEKKAREDYGPKPDTNVMAIALQSQIKSALNDPDSLQGPTFYEPSKDTLTIKGKAVNCWKCSFYFRAKNGFGAMMLNRGTIWMKNNESIKEALS